MPCWAIQPVELLGRPGSITSSQGIPRLSTTLATTGNAVCSPVIGRVGETVVSTGEGALGPACTRWPASSTARRWTPVGRRAARRPQASGSAALSKAAQRRRRRAACFCALSRGMAVCSGSLISPARCRRPPDRWRQGTERASRSTHRARWEQPARAWVRLRTASRWRRLRMAARRLASRWRRVSVVREPIGFGVVVDRCAGFERFGFDDAPVLLSESSFQCRRRLR